MTSVIRACTEEDIESILQLAAYAYAFPEGSLERFRESLRSVCHEYYMHLLDDVPTAVARLHPFTQNIRGRMMPVGGIGMVCSAPEFRHRGFVSKLLSKMLDEMNARGYAASVLYPFKDMFYGRLGYAKMPPTQMLEVNPHSFSRIVRPEGYTVRREQGEAAIAAWKKLHQTTVEATHGAIQRTDERWAERTSNIKSKIVVARNPQGEPEGVMFHSIKGYGEGHPWAEPGEIFVIERFWSSLEGRDALLSYLYGHADQVVKVKILVSPSTDDYYHWISDIHTPRTSANIVSMARVVNATQSLAGWSVTGNSEVLFVIEDARCDWNNGTYRLRAADGRLTVERVEKSCSTSLTIEGLTSLLYGTLDQDQMRRLGWLRGEFPAEVFKWFPKATPWLTEEF
jgi:predicted acetyltransferase